MAYLKPIATALFDGKHFIAANQAALSLFGYSSLLDFFAAPLHSFSPATQPNGIASNETLDAFLVKANREESVVFAWVFNNINGRPISTVVSLSQLELKGQKVVQFTVLDSAAENTVKEKLEVDVFRQMLVEGAQQFRESLIGTVDAFAKVVEARDPYTAGHQLRVSTLAVAIAKELNLSSSQTEGIRLGALVHDIGKVHLPAEILTKPTKLASYEYEIIKQHAQTGYDILKDIPFPWPVARIAFEHHERIDGSGYPQGLVGDEICLDARIVAVADVVEAMASFRPYRAALGNDAALKEISAGNGTLYDSNVVAACLKVFNEDGFAFPIR